MADPANRRRDRWRFWVRRITWLAALWAASIAVLAVFAMLLRIIMNMAGLTV